MKTTALVSLDCVDGVARRYIREPGDKPRETGRFVVPGWRHEAEQDIPQGFVDYLLRWRGMYEPPEDDGPRPTEPLRSQRAA